MFACQAIAQPFLPSPSPTTSIAKLTARITYLDNARLAAEESTGEAMALLSDAAITSTAAASSDSLPSAFAAIIAELETQIRAEKARADSAVAALSASQRQLAAVTATMHPFATTPLELATALAEVAALRKVLAARSDAVALLEARADDTLQRLQSCSREVAALQGEISHLARMHAKWQRNQSRDDESASTTDASELPVIDGAAMDE